MFSKKTLIFCNDDSTHINVCTGLTPLRNDSERGIFNNRRKPIQTFYPDKQEFIGVIVREVEHGICKQMNEGKDDGVGESEALSAHPREAKARMRY